MAGIDGKTSSCLHFEGEPLRVDECGGAWSTAGLTKFKPGVARFGAGSLYLGPSGKLVAPTLSSTNGFSVDLWVYNDVLQPGGNIFVGWASFGSVYLIYAHSDSGVLTAGVMGYSETLSATVVPLKAWNHIYAYSDATSTYIFLNGKLALTVGAAYLKFAATTFGCGCFINGAACNDGHVDELRVSNGPRWTTDFTSPTALADVDPNTLALLHLEPITVVDEAGVKWTPAGLVSTVITARFGGRALSLPGAAWVETLFDDRFDVSSGDFTVDWWEYRTGGDANACSVGLQSPAGGDGLVLGYLNGSTLMAYLATSSTVNSWLSGGLSLGPVVLNAWVHLAVVRSGSSVLLFRNGQLVKSVTYAGSLYVPTTTVLTIGTTSQEAGFTLAGAVDEFRFSKGVARWTSSFTPPTSPYSKTFFLTRTADGHYHSVRAGTWVDLGTTASRELFINNESLQPAAVEDLLKLGAPVRQCAFDESTCPVAATVKATPPTQFVSELADVDLRQVSYVDWIKVNVGVTGFEVGAGKLRLLASRDSGSTWWAFVDGAWAQVVDPGGAGLPLALSGGMPVEVFNTVDWHGWTVGAGFKVIRFAIILDQAVASDAAWSDTLTYQYDGVGDWSIATANIHYGLKTRNSAHTVTWLSPINGKRVKVNY